ncbi:MAG: hypothetical protein ACYTFI_06990 [Planctomycetota bacterium]|jgi:hypothetical protein
MRRQSTDHKVRLPRLAVVFLGCVAIACGCAEDRGSDGISISPLDLSAPPTKIVDVTPDGFPTFQEEDPPPPEDTPPPPPVEPPPETTAKGGQAADGPPPSGPGQSGPHVGEHSRLEVDIVFSRAFGETVTDEEGIHYYFEGTAAHEDKVYPSEYWGTFPLYFFGTEVGVTVTLRNLGPRAKIKARVRTEAYVLLTDGSNGAVLAEPQEIDVVVTRDEAVTIDASFTAQYTAGVESGLDRFVVKVLHPNEAGEISDTVSEDDPALITVAEGVFCPPDIVLSPEPAF